MRNVAPPETNMTNPAQGIKMPPLLVTLPPKKLSDKEGRENLTW